MVAGMGSITLVSFCTTWASADCKKVCKKPKPFTFSFWLPFSMATMALPIARMFAV